MLRRFSPLVRRLSARSKERFRGEHQGRLPSKQARSRPPSNGSNTAYVGVMAQEVQTLRPAAVVRGRDGYLRVFYEQLGLTFIRGMARRWSTHAARNSEMMTQRTR